ncbi:MAG: hypothetical protein FVQ77_03455 [Cytophagales bacterium]|nr:hypothetical protein [Cytophagales bacterium]
MKKFIIKAIWFIIPFFLIVILGLVLPTTPRASKSFLMSANKKDSLLQNVPSPRIIFVGGSNLSFGLNSKIIKNSLNINPINTAISASIDLKFMMDNALQYIKKGDIIVLVLEYSYFHRDVNSGSEELSRAIFDVNISKINLLNSTQLINIILFMPKYALSKYKITEYINVKESDVYSVNSSNEFGDTYTHWNMQQQKFPPFEQINTPFNFEIIEKIKEFHSAIKEKGASLYLSYPGFQATSFNNSIEQIHKVEQELKKTDLTILGTAERYKIPDSMMFNTPYHLNKNGVDYRTKMFIEDFNNAIR